jgi:hypothetical protein
MEGRPVIRVAVLVKKRIGVIDTNKWRFSWDPQQKRPSLQKIESKIQKGIGDEKVGNLCQKTTAD